MKKSELDLLEKVLDQEIDGAINRHAGIYQTKSKIAKKLENEGFLIKVKIVLGGSFPVTIEGYRLTLLGNFAYCTSDRCEAKK